MGFHKCRAIRLTISKVLSVPAAGSYWDLALLHFWNNWLKIKINRGDKSVPRDLQQLGSLLKSERERAGMTVRQLAEAAGLVPSTVSRLETGFIAYAHDQSICSGWRKRWGSTWKSCTRRRAT